MNSGIYKIVNLINGKIYIGSTVNFKNRKASHFLELIKNKHCNNYLQKAFNKYGIENFNFEIIATCPKEYLIKLEQWFIDTLKPEYNICKQAGSNAGIIRTQSWRQNIGKANSIKKYTEEEKKKMLQYGWNKKAIYKVCAKTFEIIKAYESSLQASKENGCNKSSILSAVNGKTLLSNGYLYCRQSEYNIETLKNKINKKFPNKVYQYDKFGNLIGIFDNGRIAAKYTKIGYNNINFAINNSGKTAGGFIWSLTDKNINNEY